MKKEVLQAFACQPIPIFFFLMVAGASVSGCGIGIESAGGKNKITSFSTLKIDFSSPLLGFGVGLAELNKFLPATSTNPT